MLFETKLKVEKTMPSGETKEVKEHYILDAEKFGEAEKIAYELYPGNKTCDVFLVMRSDIREIINQKEEDKPFFKATVIDVFVDDSGKEKETKYHMLICAENLVEATNLVNEYLKQGYDLRLDGIKRVKIVDYIRYAG